LNWNNWVRQIHRWLSIAFTVTVIANFVAMGLGEPPTFVVYSPLLPLFLLLFTGLYMFVLPYAAKWRGGRGASAPFPKFASLCGTLSSELRKQKEH
jgi:cellulose synthase/poly-beta-1,6-N-acetylglucosamine synthase-like glycosyltransferase